MEPLHNTHGRGVVLALLVVGFHVSGCGGGVSDRDVRLAASEVVEACREVEPADAALNTARNVRQATSDGREAFIDQLIAEDDQLAAAQATWQAKIAAQFERIQRARRLRRMNDELDALDRSHEFEAGRDAWLKETLNQLVAGDPKLGERLAELDDRAAEASDDASEAEGRRDEVADRVAETANHLVGANSGLQSEMGRHEVGPICETLLAADDLASEARSLLVGGIATGKKAREVFELTSEFFEACPDGNPAGWDEDDWRAFIATGDRIMGAGLPLVCDREENSAVWEMDSNLSAICSTFGADSSWWEAADKGRLTLLCQQAPRGWEVVVEKVEEADLQLQG